MWTTAVDSVLSTGRPVTFPSPQTAVAKPQMSLTSSHPAPVPSLSLCVALFFVLLLWASMTFSLFIYYANTSHLAHLRISPVLSSRFLSQLSATKFLNFHSSPVGRQMHQWRIVCLHCRNGSVWRKSLRLSIQQSDTSKELDEYGVNTRVCAGGCMLGRCFIHTTQHRAYVIERRGRLHEKDQWHLMGSQFEVPCKDRVIFKSPFDRVPNLFLLLLCLI